jgi:sugar/nucleoside kinase (ribokinase family)
MKGVANLSAGRVSCKFMGMVGSDPTAAAYRRMLEQQGVQPVLLVSLSRREHPQQLAEEALCGYVVAAAYIALKRPRLGCVTARTARFASTPVCALQETSAGPTATCLCFVTPDGQRTMRTCLGASAHLTAAEQLPAGWCDETLLLHCEGYCLYRPQLAREAMSRAKQAGALVSIDLASFECVQNCSR